jgi:GNAT superfamily N-acetyltransferase
MAFRQGNPVGRIAAIASGSEQGVEGRFGWFDVVDDLEVARSLFDAAKAWLRERGASEIIGPLGFTNLDRAGLLISGYDELATTATIYNHPYYHAHLEALGFTKARDYIEFEFKVPEIPEKVKAFADLITKRYNLRVIEKLTTASILKYGNQLFDLINETHRKLYGFKLLSDDMKQYYIKKYLPFVRPDFIVLIVNAEDKLVAYALTMPSYARAFQKARGRLFPFGFWHIYRANRHVKRADLLLIGVADALRNKGVTALIFQRVITKFTQIGIELVESNPELEDNQQVQALWQKYEYRQHKRRRVYQQEL